MASTTISIPNFQFSSFYYPQLLEALITYKRQNAPELTDESDEETSIQFMRAFALVGHLNNVLIDLIANEATLPTAQLPETIRNMLRLINYELKPAAPAQADMVFRLSKTFASSFQLVPVNAQSATQRQDDEPVIYFETLPGLTIDRTDQIGACFVESPLNTFTDRTAAAIAGTAFDATLVAGGKLYVGHTTVMWDKMNIVANTPSVATAGVWEFFDGDASDTRPDSVTNPAPGQLQFLINGLLGTVNRAGALVRVRLNNTSAFEEVLSTWDGSNNVVTTSFLGQSSPSVDANDYTVGTEWTELSGVVDGTNTLQATGDVTFTLPQTETANWQPTSINGFTGFFLRFRCITTGLGVGPSLGRIRIDTGKQYGLATATQGRTVTGETLGSSTGDVNQRFTASQKGFILDSQEVRVDDEAWTRVDNFLDSLSQDKHYRIELGTGDQPTVVFGDGVTGAIPPIGQNNIVMDYRWGATDDGNVGARTLIVDKQGLSYVEAIYNPRAAAGWSEAESASTASLEKAKITGPATLRTKEVAIGPDDVVILTQAFTSDDGSKPFSRAQVIEESFGPKTLEVVVVAHGGNTATPEQLADLQTYFNGDKNAIPRKPKHIVANQEVTASNFDPLAVDVVATVYGPSDLTAEQVVNQLASVLQPEALKEDGITFTWDFGGTVPVSRISHEIFNTDPRITKVVLTTPAVDLVLNTRQLPTKGTILITMVSTA
jgi:hypothetical protein